MNASQFLKHSSVTLFLTTLAILFTGCATQKKIDWAGRVGNYTFDQAVTELGPPDKQAKLQDGTVVAEWLIRRGYTYVYSSPAFASSYPYSFGGPSAGVTSGTSPDYYLRLTFAPDNRLKAWKKFAK
jgi:hypothetical protein